MSAIAALIAASNGKPAVAANSGPSASGSPADFAQMLRERSPLPAERMPTPLPALPDAPPAPPLINPPRQAAPTPLPPSRDEAPREQEPPRQEAAPDGAQGRAAEAQKLKHAQQERQQLERQARNRLEQSAGEKRAAQTARADTGASTETAVDVTADARKDETLDASPAEGLAADATLTAAPGKAQPLAAEADTSLPAGQSPGPDLQSASPQLSGSDTAADAMVRSGAAPTDVGRDGLPQATLLMNNRTLAGGAEASTQTAAGRPGALPLPRAGADAAQGAAGDTRALQSLGTHPHAATQAEPASSPSSPLGAGNASAFAQVMQQLGSSQPNASAASSAPAEPGAASRLDLPTPLHDPRFGPELGARLSLLASEGVQQARLHLNPAEMGPVSVQILLDGQQAQISFQAEQAQTREVLERSLPELAAALRENGLTLSGGGVFQQAQQQGQAQGDAAASGSHGTPTAQGGPEVEPGEPAGTPHAMARRSQGVLDLYA